MAATSKGTNHAQFKPLQFFFAPVHRSGTDPHTAHGARGTSAQSFSGKGGSLLGKVRSSGVKNHVAHARWRRDGLSGDHHHFPAFRSCQQFRNGCTADLSGTTKDNYGEILVHE